MEKGIKRPKHKTTRQWWGERMKEAEAEKEATKPDRSRAQAEIQRGHAVLIASAWAMKDKADQVARDASERRAAAVGTKAQATF